MVWIIKLSGLFLLFASCCMYGAEKELRLKRQWELLVEWKHVLICLEKEMTCHQTPIYEALRQAADGRSISLQRFLIQVSQAAEQRDGRSFEQIWKEVFEREFPETQREWDRRVMDEAALAVCAHDTVMQRTAVSCCVNRMEEEIRQAYERWQEKGKLCRRLSVTGGAFLVILLF